MGIKNVGFVFAAVGSESLYYWRWRNLFLSRQLKHEELYVMIRNIVGYAFLQTIGRVDQKHF